uniref:Anti-sigma factor antagonist n=1 Tax=Fervidobacterium pennivorans TaxID=93466 RepID=A0A7V4NGA5_FERPE
MQKSVLGDVIKFILPDELELTNAQQIKKTIYEEAFEKGFKKVILDLSKTKYIDSTGLGVMVAIHKQALMNAGAVVFLNLDSNIKGLLKMTALDRILNIYDNEKEAIEFLNK